VRRAVFLALAIACARPAAVAPAPARATLVDLHVDVPFELRFRHLKLDALQASPARLARGGVAVILAPLYVPHAYEIGPARAREAYASSYETFRGTAGALGVEAWLSFEGADGFADDPSAIDPWIARGACLVALVHSHSNALGGASQDPSRAARARGLTDAGKRLAEHVLARGALLDVAHASDATFDDLLEIARAHGAPVVDSHTGLRAIRNIMRNIDDARLRALAATGGVAGISVHSGHIGTHPGEPATLGDVADAIEHAVAVAGIDHVAIGSDFDGMIDPPRGTDGESMWPALRALLASRGMSQRDIDAIWGDNARRVFEWPRAHGCTPGAR